MTAELVAALLELLEALAQDVVLHHEAPDDQGGVVLAELREVHAYPVALKNGMNLAVVPS